MDISVFFHISDIFPFKPMAALPFWWCCHWCFYWPIAQLVERLSVKQDVVGSIPTWSATVLTEYKNKKEVNFYIVTYLKK